MRLVLLLSFLLIGCDAFGGEDEGLISNPAFDVYDLVFTDDNGPAASADVRIGVSLFRSDAVDPREEAEPNLGAGIRGTWEIDEPTRWFPVEGGSIRGSLGRDGRTLDLYFFSERIVGDVDDEGVIYTLTGTLDGENMQGTWDRLASYPQGSFEGTLVRLATEPVRVP